MRFVAFAAAFALPLLSACAVAPIQTGPSGLLTCVYAAGDGHPDFEPRLTGMMMLQVVPSLATARQRGCDAAVRIHHPNGRSVRATAEIFSARTGQSLGKVSAGGYFLEAMASGLRSAMFAQLQPGRDARAALDRDISSQPPRAGVDALAAADDAPSPAAPRGLSAADIERIARAVRAPETPATPAAPATLIAPRFSSPERPDDLAVIVGVESYSDIATKAPYAERDADAFKSFVRALGVPERNIVLLKGPKAVKSSLEKNLEGWLPRLAKPDSRVYFYFSGHGAPEVKTGQAYLVPWDGDPNFLEATAYPVSRLYQKLGALPAKQVLVAMDSCFSGAGGRSVLASGARPLVSKVETGAVPAKLTVLAASAASEISGSLDDRQHGAFTYFLLEGLNAGRTGAKALHAYLAPKVQDEARRLNRDQTPQLIGADLTLR